VVLLASGIGSNTDVPPVVPLAAPRGERCWPRRAAGSKSTLIPRPVADAPPVVSPAPSPGNGCWPGSVILAVKIGFRPMAAAPPVKIGCRYAASPVVLPPVNAQAKMILLSAERIKGRSAVDQSMRARADNRANGTVQKSREQIPGEVFFSGSRFAGLFRPASLRQRRWHGDTTATDSVRARRAFSFDFAPKKGRLQYHDSRLSHLLRRQP
jgi:hypothetical protein